jgi:hypothetical protein
MALNSLVPTPNFKTGTLFLETTVMEMLNEKLKLGPEP